MSAMPSISAVPNAICSDGVCRIEFRVGHDIPHVPIHKLPPQTIEALKAHNPNALTGFEVLDSNDNSVLDDADRYVSVSGGNTVIDLGAAAGGVAGVDVLTVMQQSALTATNFIA